MLVILCFIEMALVVSIDVVVSRPVGDLYAYDIFFCDMIVAVLVLMHI